ncbi:hypothetical protein H0H93_013549, partial [Arthromyces matolae]
AEKHATKDPIAVKYNITTITPAIIAYSACQTRFALSSVSQWGMQDGLFSMPDFYYNVLSLFDPPSDPWAISTLEFWNKRFFSPDGTVNRKRKLPPPPPHPSSDVSRLKRARLRRQQIEEVRREREDQNEYHGRQQTPVHYEQDGSDHQRKPVKKPLKPKKRRRVLNRIDSNSPENSQHDAREAQNGVDGNEGEDGDNGKDGEDGEDDDYDGSGR